MRVLGPRATGAWLLPLMASLLLSTSVFAQDGSVILGGTPQTLQLVDPVDGGQITRFGAAVAMDGDVMVVDLNATPEPGDVVIAQQFDPATGEAQTAPVRLPSQIPSAEVVKVQAALRAFGNADVVVDGVSGAQTEAAIREFQALFHLPVTGEIDGTLLDKMRAVGLIQ